MVNCHCLKCDTDQWEANKTDFSPQTNRMYVCAKCGNKRCPHSDDHRNLCSASNEPGQPGSRYTKTNA